MHMRPDHWASAKPLHTSFSEPPKAYRVWQRLDPDTELRYPGNKMIGGQHMQILPSLQSESEAASKVWAAAVPGRRSDPEHIVGLSDTRLTSSRPGAQGRPVWAPGQGTLQSSLSTGTSSASSILMNPQGRLTPPTPPLIKPLASAPAFMRARASISPVLDASNAIAM